MTLMRNYLNRGWELYVNVYRFIAEIKQKQEMTTVAENYKVSFHKTDREL